MKNEANLAYRETGALTTDPVGLVVVLYDMLLKDIRDAISALASSDIQRRAEAIRHSMLVLQQLQGTLDMEKGGVVATNLDRFYNFIRAKLLEGQIKVSSEIFRQQAIFVMSIRDAWEQVRTEQLRATEPEPHEDAAPIAVSILSPESAASAEWSA